MSVHFKMLLMLFLSLSVSSHVQYGLATSGLQYLLSCKFGEITFDMGTWVWVNMVSVVYLWSSKAALLKVLLDRAIDKYFLAFLFNDTKFRCLDIEFNMIWWRDYSILLHFWNHLPDDNSRNQFWFLWNNDYWFNWVSI